MRDPITAILVASDPIITDENETAPVVVPAVVVGAEVVVGA